MAMNNNDQTNRLDVAVIGVGTAGVSALRWCKARNLNVVGFDKEDRCGGIWRCGSAHSPAYDSLYTNSSGVMMSMGDFNRKFKAEFPHHSETCDYYDEYMKLHELNELVKWRTVVEKLFKNNKDKWVVEYRHLDGDSATFSSMEFDRVLICTGKLWDPSYPSWVTKEKQDQLRGTMDVLHSRDYRNPGSFAGKKVVVVGVGNSALDISLELARDPNVQKPILVSCRRGTVVMPIDNAKGEPVDLVVTTRAFQYLASGGARNKIMVDNVKVVNEQFRKFGLPLPPNPKNYFAIENPVSNLKDSRGYLTALKAGHIKFVDGVVDFGEDGKSLITGAKESIENVDAVVLCTGYRVGLDFLETSVRSQVVRNVIQKNGHKAEYVDLYKNVIFAPDPSLAFLVFLTSYGNESIVGSMQARWMTRFWTDTEFAKRMFSFEKFQKESASRFKFVVGSSTPNAYFVRKFSIERSRDRN